MEGYKGSIPYLRVVVGFLFLLAPVFVNGAEIIDSFESDITVAKDGSLTVVETIAYDFDSEERHGIFRDIPTAHPEKASTWYKERYVDIQVTEVKRNGSNEPFEVTASKGMASVKIGDPEKTITGKHTYKATYVFKGALVYPPQLPPELYLNVNGTGWPVGARVVRATVRGEAVDMLSLQRSCYKGVVGSGNSCTIRDRGDGSVTFEATNVAPHETVTLAQAFNDGAVKVVRVERLRTTLLAVVAAVVWLLLLSWFVYRYRTEHKKNNVVVAEYEPYPGILPMQMGVLKDGSLDPKDIAAGIVYLAEQGYLTIRRTERKVLFVFDVTDYELTLLRRPSDGVWRNDILQLMFDEPLAEGTTTTLSELKSNRTKQVSNHEHIEKLEKAILEDLIKEGFYATPSGATSWVQIVLWVASCIGIIGVLFLGFTVVTVVSVVTLILTIVLVSLLSRRLTPKGYEALRYLSGFKEYLSVAEKDRIDFHNAPERNPEQFLAFLPYAIAFGVEKKWAEAFKDITIPTPSWYDGGSAGFMAADLSSSLGGFSSALASSAGGSASSGGGSAGGGVGGGGGGSW